MAEVIRMPKMSDTMEEGVIAAWLKKEGDTVSITNGKGHIFAAQIITANPKKCKAEIVSRKKIHESDSIVSIVLEILYIDRIEH